MAVSALTATHSSILNSQPQPIEGDHICCFTLSIQNESDVLKWVVRKEFGELRRCLEEEEVGFMQQVETSAAVFILSLQNQTDQLNQNLNRLQEAHNTLQELSNEGHLDFIMVFSVRDSDPSLVDRTFE